MMMGVPAYAVDLSAFPETPTLYAQAAVLMDADTGQVLFEKNMHKRMPPASLTKIMTILVALRQGRMDSTVTVEDDWVKLPLAGTTHIALTGGEQLTLEQLTYATMVQSANDAAQIIAYELAGSIPMFSKIMNEVAAELGARESNFENPHGLPDDSHYSTAYDLALLTREAFRDPRFAEIAGCKKYEIPATNKNPQPRVLNHGNYMFNLSDTYDGAFAGKTGWTQEAGHCLMTVARRNGVTLICVVLKSDGAVDAEFKDSTALFDYGFDYFRRVTLPKERFPSQQISYTNEQGEQREGMLTLNGTDMPVLLAAGVEDTDISIRIIAPEQLSEADLVRLRVEARVPEVAGEVMVTTVGSFPVHVEQLEPVVNKEERPAWYTRINWRTVGIVAMCLLVALVVAGVVLLLLARKLVRIYYRSLLYSKRAQGWISSADLYLLSTVPVEEEDLAAFRRDYAGKFRLLGICMEDLGALAHARAMQRRKKRQAPRRTATATVVEREEVYTGPPRSVQERLYREKKEQAAFDREKPVRAGRTTGRTRRPTRARRPFD